MKNPDYDAIMARARQLEPPVLSLYLPVEPGGDSARRALTRARSTMRATATPSEVRERVEEVVQAAPAAGRCLAVFANAGETATTWLDTEVPPEPLNGAGYARWGELDLSPLLYLDARHERAAALYVDRDHWRLFEVWLDGVREVDRGERAESPGERDSLEQSKQDHPAYVASRGGAAHDNAMAHLDVLAHRFHSAAVRALDARFPEGPVALLGPPDAVADTMSVASHLRERVIARLAGLSSPDAAAGEVLERLAPTLRERREARRDATLDDALAGGIHGVADTLYALQEGRLATVVAAWPIDEVDVYDNADTGYTAAVRHHPSVAAGTVRARSLREVLAGLCERCGAELELVAGARAGRLRGEAGCVAGIARW